MAYRSYPNADRALKQLDRHRPSAPVISMPPALRAVSESIGQLRENTQRAASQGFGSGTYVLSTRRPGAVSGPA
ncbi:hypothetical protein [Streptomyces swartbergensis]|uniref:Uncharacterized protein n=1 Tax=Streptomyces swartbergensis TaxID=487165 RepID=A0A243SAI5_9ACTN|nr:hypothetical protein [Streptomyces swartbergensis]OUD04723.1 hypothetical protein CA983_02930 [Streptomyces swartbergensis]